MKLKRKPVVKSPDKPPSDRLYHNRRQTAHAINIGTRALDEWKARGWIPYIKIGSKTVLFDLTAVKAAIERRFGVKAKD
jgi:hypothetical protein